MEIPGVDASTSQAISGLVKESGQETVGGLHGNYMAGANQASGLLKPNAQAEKTLAMDPMADAIKNKYAQKFGMSQNRLRHETKLGAQVDHLKKLEVATNLANEEHAVNMERARIQEEMKRQKKAMRGQLLGSILGIVGGAAGAYLGSAGGPAGTAAGAMAGSQLGQGTGQMVGGS